MLLAKTSALLKCVAGKISCYTIYNELNMYMHLISFPELPKPTFTKT